LNFKNHWLDIGNIIDMAQISDQQLRTYIDQVFGRYDRDNGGSLDVNELANFFNDVFQMTGNSIRVTQQDAIAAMRAIDRNNDGRANKPELFNCFKSLMGGQRPGQGQQGGYGQQQGGYGQQQGGYGQQGQQGGYGQQQGGYGQQGQQGGYGQQGQQQGQWGNQPQQGGQQGQWGNQPQQGGQQGQWGNQQQGGQKW
jgi:hypothetical protein